MNGIGLSTTIYDVAGSRYIDGYKLDAETAPRNNKRDRRVSITATLDGGVSVYDTGYSVGDREITVRVSSPDKAVADFFAYLVETYNTIVVTTDESAFRGVPERFYLDPDGAAVLVVHLTAEA